MRGKQAATVGCKTGWQWLIGITVADDSMETDEQKAVSTAQLQKQEQQHPPNEFNPDYLRFYYGTQELYPTSFPPQLIEIFLLNIIVSLSSE